MKARLFLQSGSAAQQPESSQDKAFSYSISRLFCIPGLCRERRFERRIRNVAGVVRHGGYGKTRDNLKCLCRRIASRPQVFELAITQMAALVDQRFRVSGKRGEFFVVW